VPHVHGAEYFACLVQVVGATQPGDRIFFTDWRGDADERLADDGPTSGEMLAGAAGRGVEVRGLLWRSHSDKMRLNAQENRHLGALINEAGGEALFDERVRRGGSHHQKLFVVQRQGRPQEDVAFIGGIDLCHPRRVSQGARCTFDRGVNGVLVDARVRARPPNSRGSAAAAEPQGSSGSG
jgi:hypothetical protein